MRIYTLTIAITMLPVCREHFLLPERMGKLETKRIIMDEKAMQRAIARISYEIIERNKGVSGLCIVGIISRGVPLGRRICAKLSELEGAEVPFGSLDITKYRDDHSGADHNDRTDIPFDIRDKNVIIVDDVIFTGRSSRAAMDAIIKRGRPRSIQLAVLIDRGHRELPIRPDYIGKNLPTSHSEVVKVSVSELDSSDGVAIYQNSDQ